MQLPVFKDDNDLFQRMQSKWKSQLDPVLANLLLQGNPVTGIKLVANIPLVVNHGLGRTPLGFFQTDLNANAVVWRTQPYNSTSITLEASANVTLNIWVY